MTRLATELDPAELPATIRRMATVVGWQNWHRRIEGLRSELESNPIWQQFLHERHGLELAFGDIHRHIRTTGRCPWPPRTAQEYRLYSFLAGAVRVHSDLSESGKARFAGALRSALEKEFGLGPLAFEITVATHLMGRGLDVDFHDLETGGGFDFLARHEAVCMEVECKHISADIGRQIHRRKIYALGGILRPAMEQAMDQTTGGLLLHVTLPSRLTGNREEQKGLAQRISAAMLGKSVKVDDSVCTVSRESFSLETSPFCLERGHNLTLADVQDFLGAAFGIDNANVLSIWRPNHAAVILHFESQKPDRVLDKIFERLKTDAKRQFSGEQPAILCVHMADLTEAQLRELADADRAGNVTGLQAMISGLLERRPHLHTVSIMTDGNVNIKEERSSRGVTVSTQEMGPSYTFRNPDHVMADNPIVNQIFI